MPRSVSGKGLGVKVSCQRAQGVPRGGLGPLISQFGIAFFNSATSAAVALVSVNSGIRPSSEFLSICPKFLAPV